MDPHCNSGEPSKALPMQGNLHCPDQGRVWVVPDCTLQWASPPLCNCDFISGTSYDLPGQDGAMSPALQEPSSPIAKRTAFGAKAESDTILLHAMPQQRNSSGWHRRIQAQQQNVLPMHKHWSPGYSHLVKMCACLGSTRPGSKGTDTQDTQQPPRV
eukprot:340513-Pelagomonas_calceolata.AAC.6